MNIDQLRNRDYKIPNKLMFKGNNPKLNKHTKIEALKKYWEMHLNLIPSNISGYEVCASKSKGCAAACLHTAAKGFKHAETFSRPFSARGSGRRRSGASRETPYLLLNRLSYGFCSPSRDTTTLLRTTHWTRNFRRLFRRRTRV